MLIFFNIVFNIDFKLAKTKIHRMFFLRVGTNSMNFYSRRVHKFGDTTPPPTIKEEREAGTKLRYTQILR